LPSHGRRKGSITGLARGLRNRERLKTPWKSEGARQPCASGCPSPPPRPRRTRRGLVSGMIAYAVVDDALSPDFPLGDSVDVFVRREDAERFITEVRGDDPEVADKLRIEERELEAGGLN
jgi:hypothetical protein